MFPVLKPNANGIIRNIIILVTLGTDGTPVPVLVRREPVPVPIFTTTSCTDIYFHDSQRYRYRNFAFFLVLSI